MTRFADVLKQAGERLQVPEPTRSRILLEIASDLEDSFQHYREAGCDEAEAVRRAVEAFGLSDDSLRLLVRIHRPGLPDRVSRQVGSWWSKALLVALVGFEILLAVRVLSDRAFALRPSPFVWPIVVFAAGALGFTVWKLVQIYSGAGTDVRRLRVGLGVPLFLAAASLGVAGLGLLVHLQRFLRLNAAGAPEALFRNFAGWMVSVSSLMIVGLMTAIVAALVWFGLSHLVVSCERREVDALLGAVG